MKDNSDDIIEACIESLRGDDVRIIQDKQRKEGLFGYSVFLPSGRFYVASGWVHDYISGPGHMRYLLEINGIKFTNDYGIVFKEKNAHYIEEKRLAKLELACEHTHFDMTHPKKTSVITISIQYLKQAKEKR